MPGHKATPIYMCKYFFTLQTMFYTLTRETSAKEASCKPRVFAFLKENASMNSTGNDTDGRIRQEVEKRNYSGVPGVGFASDSSILTWLKADHCQPDYADYTKSGTSVVQSILNVSGTLDAHADVRKFGGVCETGWGIHPNVKFLLLFFSFVVQYICIHL